MLATMGIEKVKQRLLEGKVKKTSVAKVSSYIHGHLFIVTNFHKLHEHGRVLKFLIAYLLFAMFKFLFTKVTSVLN